MLDSPGKTAIRFVATGSVILGIFGAAGNARAQGDWKERWAKTVEAAEREGRIVIHAGPGEDPFYQAFQVLLTDPPYLDLEPVRNLVNEVWKKRK